MTAVLDLPMAFGLLPPARMRLSSRPGAARRSVKCVTGSGFDVTWFKVDDSFYDHPKMFDAPDCAVALWTRAGAWASRNLTDGFVPSKLPARFCDDPETAVRELLQRRMWRRTSGGYLFHEWSTNGDGSRRNPTRKEVEEDRQAARERMKRLRAGRNPDGSEDVRANNDRTSSEVRDPRPEPEGSKEPSRPRKRATRIPEDFDVTSEMVAWCRTECPNVDGKLETKKFVDHWRGKAGKDATKQDWPATWRNWMRRAEEFTGSHSAGDRSSEAKRRDVPEALL